MSQNLCISFRYCFHPSTYRDFYEDIDITDIDTFVLGGLRQARTQNKTKPSGLRPVRHQPGSGRRAFKTKAAGPATTANSHSALASGRQGTTAFKVLLEGHTVTGCEIHGSTKDQTEVH